MKLTGRGATECSASDDDDDDGFSEATVNSRCLDLPHRNTHTNTHNTQTYVQSGGEIDLKSGGSADKALVLLLLSTPIVITYWRATWAAGTSSFNITLWPQQVFNPKTKSLVAASHVAV